MCFGMFKMMPRCRSYARLDSVFDKFFQRKEKDRTEQSAAQKTTDSADLKHRTNQGHFETQLSFLSAKLKASLTIEAAVALPLFIFMMLILLFPLKLMEEERRLQNTAENIGRQLAATEYVKTVGSDFLKDKGNIGGMLSGTADTVEKGAALGLILAEAGKADSIAHPVIGSETAVFSDAEGNDPAMFRVELDYSLKLPFSTYSIPAVRKSLTVNRRAWIGSEGGRGRNRYGKDTGDAEDEDRIVYLGKTSTVYHEDPNCHYLSNVMKSADASDIGNLRNESGGKYHACPSCKPGKTGTVYYFASGTAYHSSEHCKAITSYSRAVRLSEVKNMRACSYCGRSH